MVRLLVFIGCIGFLAASSHALAAEKKAATSGASTAAADTPKEGMSVAPVIGYEPTYRLVVGGAYFYRGRSLSWGIDGNLNFRNVYQVHSRLDYELNPSFLVTAKAGFLQGFDPYYGEGGHTELSQFSRIWGLTGTGRLKFIRKVDEALSIGWIVDTRFRQEKCTLNTTSFPDETTTGVGFVVGLEQRDSVQNPTDGFHLTLSTLFFPTFLSTHVTRRDFGQVEAALIAYKKVLNQIADDIVVAMRLMGGVTVGEPTYLFHYRLGGAERLQGYHENRFRGRKYYLQQTELRFPLWKIFSGSLFLGFGDITHRDFTFAKVAYGSGVRIALPPHWVDRVRVDVGFGKDQWGVFADFGHTF